MEEEKQPGSRKLNDESGNKSVFVFILWMGETFLPQLRTACCHRGALGVRVCWQRHLHAAMGLLYRVFGPRSQGEGESCAQESVASLHVHRVLFAQG